MKDFVGYLAGILATLAFIPQVVKTLRSGRTGDISLGMYVMFCSGVGLWVVYGLLLSSGPLVISNLVTLTLAGTVLLMKLRIG